MTRLTVLDIGLTNDHCAAATVHREPSGTVVVDDIFHRVGTRLAPVQFVDIEQHMVRLSRRFASNFVLLADQWQARQLLQRMKARGIRTDELTFGATYHDHIARNLLEMVREGRIRCFHHEALQTQLKHVVLRRSQATGRDDSSIKVKIDSGAGVGVAGKDDIVVALAAAAYEITESRRWQSSVAVIKVGGQKFASLREELDFCAAMDRERAAAQGRPW